MTSVDSEERSSTTSDDDNSSEMAASIPNQEEGNVGLNAEIEEKEKEEDDRFVVYVKGNPETKVMHLADVLHHRETGLSILSAQALKDCAYCHRVLLILEEKEVPYTLELIDPRHKPEWLIKAFPTGHLPLIQDGDTYVTESGKIADFIEEKYPQPRLPVDEEGIPSPRNVQERCWVCRNVGWRRHLRCISAVFAE